MRLRSFAAGMVYAIVVVVAILALLDGRNKSHGQFYEERLEVVGLRDGSVARAKSPVDLSAAGAARVGDEVLFVGGVESVTSNAPKPVTSTWFFDPSRETWRSGPPLHVARALPVLCTFSDGRVLVVRGEEDTTMSMTSAVHAVDMGAPAELSTPSHDGWIEIPELSGTLDAVEVSPGRVLVDRVRSMELWSPADRVRVVVPRPLDDLEPGRPPDRYGDKSTRFTRLNDGRVAVLASHENQYLLRAFSPASRTWETLVRTDKVEPIAVAPSGGLLLPREDAPSSLFTPAGMTELPPLPGVDADSSSLALPNDRLLFVGGYGFSDAAASGTIALLDLRAKSVSTNSKLRAPRRHPNLVSLGDDRVLVHGGESRKVPDSLARRFTIGGVLLLAWLALPLAFRRRLRAGNFVAGAIVGGVVALAASAFHFYAQGMGVMHM